MLLIVATRVMAWAAAVSLPPQSQRIAINAIPTQSMMAIRQLRSIGRGFNRTEARCPSWRSASNGPSKTRNAAKKTSNVYCGVYPTDEIHRQTVYSLAYRD